MDTEFVVNEAISFSQLRVVNALGEQLGVMDKPIALRRAQQLGLDLVVISDKVIPPVAKIIDYGKFKYENTKREKERVKKQKESMVETKEVYLRPVTDDHDKDVKSKHIQKFINDGYRVKIGVKFKGREATHENLGHDMLNSILKSISGYKVEHAITSGEKNIFTIISPDKPK